MLLLLPITNIDMPVSENSWQYILTQLQAATSVAARDTGHFAFARNRDII
jgi:hypothetical protein